MYGKDTLAVIRLGAAPGFGSFSASMRTFAVDTAGDIWACAYVCRKAMAVNEVALNLSGLTGTPTFTVSLQALDASGNPTGTVLGGGSPASTQFSPVANGLQWVTLDNAYSVAQDEKIAIVIEDGSTPNINASHHIDVDSFQNQFGVSQPYPLENTGGGYSKIGDTIPGFGLRASGTTDDVQGFPVEMYIRGAVVVAANGNRIVAEFKIPASMGSRVQIHGVIPPVSLSTGDYKVGLWSPTTQMAITGTQDKDAQANTTVSGTFFFAPVWLDTDTVYYVGIEQVGAGVIIGYTADCVTDDNLSAFPPGQQMLNFSGGFWGGETTGELTVSAMLLVSDFDRGLGNRGDMRGGLQ